MRPKVLVSAYACLVNPEVSTPGGGDLMAWNVIEGLARQCDIWVVTCERNRKAIEEELSRGAMPGVVFQFVGLSPRLTPLLRRTGGLHVYAYLWQWAAYFAARRLHARVRFDLVHHLTYENDWMASIVGALLPVPFVRGPGGGAHRIPRPFLRGFSFRARVLERIRAAGQWLFRRDPFFLLGQSRARVILACNREALEGVPRRWRRKVGLLSVNGIAAHELAYSCAYERGETYRVLSAGRLIPLKGFDLALRGFAAFARKCPSAEMIIVGSGPELANLRGLIRDLHLEQSAHIERWMPREELLDTMTRCDAFLFASLRDGGGLVVVEAMAAGKPVVCLDLGGPGLHVDESCGIKVAARNPDQVVADIAEALERLWGDPELSGRLGRGALERARRVYDWGRVAEQIMAAYEVALGSPLTCPVENRAEGA
jgi:glycosyltransferase involved in cell wall biosynthesis